MPTSSGTAVLKKLVVSMPLPKLKFSQTVTGNFPCGSISPCSNCMPAFCVIASSS